MDLKATRDQKVRCSEQFGTNHCGSDARAQPGDMFRFHVLQLELESVNPSAVIEVKLHSSEFYQQGGVSGLSLISHPVHVLKTGLLACLTTNFGFFDVPGAECSMGLSAGLCSGLKSRMLSGEALKPLM